MTNSMVMSDLVQIGMHAGRGGGVDRYFDGLMNAFDSAGVAARGGVFGEKTDTLPHLTECLGSAKESLTARLRSIRQFIASGSGTDRPKLIASHFALYSLPALRAFGKPRGMKMISHFHGPWADESAAENERWLSVAMKRLVERWVYSRSDLIVSDSQAFGDLVCERYGIAKAKVHAVHAGTDAKPFMDAAKSTVADARHRLGLPQDKKIVVTVRRLARRMGIDNLIQAVSQIAREHPDLLVVIAGKGYLKAELQSQIEKLGLSSMIQMLGYVAEEDLPYVYRAADLSIVPSIALEGFGLVAVESLATGTPVMVSPIGGMPEIVRPLKSDLVLPGCSIDDLAKGLSGFLRGEMILPTMSECIKYVDSNYTWERVLPKLLKVYDLVKVS